MTRFEDRNRGKSGLSLFVFGPVLALGTFTALLALLAGMFGWHSNQMLVTSAAVGAAVVVAALALVYRQITKRHAAEGALHDVEARVASIVESAMDAIITVDEKQRVVMFNAAAEAMFGCPRGQAIGAPLAWFIPERFRAEHERHIRRFGETGISSRRMGAQRIVAGLRSGGGEFPIDASISQITEGGKKFYTVILRDVTERVQAEEALRRSQEELRELASGMNSVREQEKSRIARELHDELGQALTAEWLVQDFTQRTGIPCDLHVGSPELELKDPHATAVFRILQESLTNVARHAKAQRVEVALARADGTVTLNVRDNGRGFSLDDPRRPNAFGLMGLRERVYLLGGEVRIESEPGRGTSIAVQIPVEGRAQAA